MGDLAVAGCTNARVPVAADAGRRALRLGQRYHAGGEIDRTYAGNFLRLTLLAPEIVQAIVEGRQPAEMTLPVLMRQCAVEWEEQR